MSFETLSIRVLDWAKERGIFEKGDALAQLAKTQEELDETIEAIKELQDLNHHGPKMDPALTDMDGVMDGIGDMLVTIIILSEMMNLNPVDCLCVAYEEIKDRTGKMVGGQFVKDK
jgi:NTP pyrophosphatase (non-canonical NTP hydrolase)